MPLLDFIINAAVIKVYI